MMLMKLIATLAMRRIPAAARVSDRSPRTPLVMPSITQPPSALPLHETPASHDASAGRGWPLLVRAIAFLLTDRRPDAVEPPLRKSVIDVSVSPNNRQRELRRKRRDMSADRHSTFPRATVRRRR